MPTTPSAVISAETSTVSLTQNVASGGGKPTAKALYDFDADNAQELSFKDGEIIDLVRRVDENWLEGRTADGKQGLFPSNYVEVLVPVPE